MVFKKLIARLSTKEERFRVQELFDMYGDEFLLQVKSSAYIESCKRGREEAGEEIREGDLAEAMLTYITKREPYHVHGYYVGRAETASLLEDGIHMPDLIPENHIHEDFIFLLEDVQLPDPKFPILTGTVSPLDVSKNEVGEPLESRVTIKLTRLPEYKSPDTFAYASGAKRREP